MRLKPLFIDADAPLALIIQRLNANEYYANFELADGNNVVRFDHVKKKSYTYLYFHSNTYQNQAKRIKDIVNTIDMPSTNDPVFESKLIKDITILSCYIVEEIDNNVLSKQLKIKKSSYNFLYSFAYSLKDKKIVLLKPAFYSSTKHRATNEFIKMLFNVEYSKKKKPLD